MNTLKMSVEQFGICTSFPAACRRLNHNRCTRRNECVPINVCPIHNTLY